MRECEESSRSVHSRIASRLAIRQNGTRVKHAGGAKGSRQLLHYRTKFPVWPGN